KILSRARTRTRQARGHAAAHGEREDVAIPSEPHRRNEMSYFKLTRREVGLGLAAAGSITIIRRARAADFTLHHLQNLPVESPLQKRALELWAAVRAETQGRV